MVPPPEYLVEVSLKVLSSKAMIDPDKGALDLRIDGFHSIDVRSETWTGILSGTVIDRMIAGYDRRDPATVIDAQPDFTAADQSARRLRIAWSPTLGYARVDPEIQQITAKAITTIEGMGMDVDLVDHLMEDPVDLWAAEFYAGVGTKLRQIVLESPETLDAAVLEVVRTALSQDMNSYYQKVFARYTFRETMRQFFERYDLLIHRPSQ